MFPGKALKSHVFSAILTTNDNDINFYTTVLHAGVSIVYIHCVSLCFLNLIISLNRRL